MNTENEFLVSPMITCPNCESGDIDRRFDEGTYEYEIHECHCLNCGGVWKEIEFNPDEDEY